MEGKILNYSISLAVCLLTAFPLRAQNMFAPQGKNPSKTEKKDKKEK